MKVQNIGFDRTGTLPVIAIHEFETADGQLVHRIDDRLRAVVPPEGWDDYLAAYPAAAPVVEHLRNQPAAVQVNPAGQ